MRTRRSFLAEAPLALTLLACNREGGGAKAPEKKGEEDISPTEDLMREHGLLARILVIYEEAERRLEGVGAPGQWPIETVAKSASIVRRFVEDYHEKQEEEDLFPRLEKAGKLAPLVATLRRQHQAGRALTDAIRELSTPATLADAGARKRLQGTLASFTRMYRPHAAQEDTVVFPAFRDLLSDKDIHDLGEKFEAREHAMFGEEGFETIRDEVAALEKQLGIDDLSHFSPS